MDRYRSVARGLTGGSTRCDGRVDYFNKGQWGTVCAESWDIDDAAVVCRQLDCGKESTLNQCPQRPYPDRTCNNTVVAGVFCTGKRELMCAGSEGGPCCLFVGHSSIPLATYAVYFAFTESLAVRLVNSTDECSGRVEVRHGAQWHTVCDTDWTLSKAGVVCESLQCGRVEKAHGGAVFGRGSGPVVEASNSCFDNVTSLQQCSVKGFTRATCGHEYDAGVLCQPPIRLVNGTDRCSGRVEILHEGQWGTVCDDDWDLRDAEVVCRAMDCGPPQRAKSSAFFGEGQGKIWLDDVNCLGNEMFLGHCRHSSFGEHNCGHGEDAGVICSGKNIIVSFNTTIFLTFKCHFGCFFYFCRLELQFLVILQLFSTFLFWLLAKAVTHFLLSFPYLPCLVSSIFFTLPCCEISFAPVLLFVEASRDGTELSSHFTKSLFIFIHLHSSMHF
uniref:Soluble scavenger receptor cysteine-rich domain-containing protein SSC5D n=1 Tax=Oreochromis aureus TaxID=47969 RepID=A0AAZ1XEB8_OREAU